jgi:hypothetical protein
VKYQRHILHENGTWSWIGTVSTVHGDQSVVLTFGKDGVFGLVPQASGYPLRIVTRQGETRVVQTDARAMARSAKALGLYSRPDYFIPPRVMHGGSAASPQPAAAAPVQAAASGPVTIDVMVAYTPGFVTETGSQNAAVTRIQNLVDLTNQAYTASGVNQQIRPVKTTQVDYPDNTSNQNALDDITGINENGNPVPIPVSLQGIAPLRALYGADLVVLMRSYDNTTQDGCGVGWLNGGNQTPITSQSSAYGYSVVSDGISNGYYCLDTTFAHELGHNMGDAHDRANASEPGAYSYSYGYLGNGSNGFSTIMAYGTQTTTPLSVFSNPNISICQNTPCGVADSSSSSADNAHSMNNTAAAIAAFRPTKSGPPAGLHVHNDINNDGKSDIFFTQASTHQLVYWLMQGAKFAGWKGFTTAPNYQLIATGDFDGDGYTDLLWNAGGTLHMWHNSRNGYFADKTFLAAPSSDWHVIGTGDIDGNGSDDIFWYSANTHQLVWWLVQGASYKGYGSANVTSGFTPRGVGDLNGDGLADVVWTDSSNKLYVWIGDSTKFTQYLSNGYIGTSWVASGIGDVDGDGNDDVIWYRPDGGGLQYWLMKGSQVTAYKAMAAGASYVFAGVGDFDGDGYADVLWKSSDNVIWMWLHTSRYNYGGYKVLPVSAGWDIVP